MKTTLIAGILLLFSFAGMAQEPLTLVQQKTQCRNYAFYWVGMGVGVAGLTTIGYHQIRNDQNFITKTGAVLGTVCLYGVIYNLVKRRDIIKKIKLGQTTFMLQPSEKEMGLCLRF
jgi:hypothetical protein